MIPVYKPFITDKEKKYVREAIDSGWISANGNFVGMFEEKFKEKFGFKYAIAVSNGTVALQCAVQYLGNEYKKFIIPNMCYIAIPNSISTYKNKSFFLGENDLSTMNLKIEEILEHKHLIDAIIFVYNYSNIDNAKEIKRICIENDIFFIEDACEALGCKFEETYLGGFGDIGVFSFFGNKTITTGEGGMIVTNNKKIYEACWELCYQGIKRNSKFLDRYNHLRPGNNFRMTNLQAAIGVAQLENFEIIKELKNRIYDFYRKNIDPKFLFDENPYILPDKSNFVNWLFCIKSKNRDGMIKHLEENKIESRPFFKPTNSFSFYNYHKGVDKESYMLSNIGINIPSYPELTEKELNKICDVINIFEEK